MAIVGQKYRTQILFEPEQHKALTEVAQQQGRSVSEVVREIVQRYLDEQSDEVRLRERMDALESIKEHRAEILARRDGAPLCVDIVASIDQMRKERTDEILAAGFGDRD